MSKLDKLKLLFILILTVYFLFTIYVLLKEDDAVGLEGGDIKKAQETNQYY